MDLSKWLVDTTELQAALNRAVARNEEVQETRTKLMSVGLDEGTATIVLDQRYPHKLAFTVGGDVNPAPTPPARTPRARTPKTEVEANAAAALSHLDAEGLTNRQLATATGFDAATLRSALMRLQRDGKATCEGKLWRLA